MNFQEKCDLINQIKLEYQTQEAQGDINIAKIAKQFNKPASTLYDIVRSGFAEPKLSTKYTNEEVYQMRDKFNSGLNCREIGEEYHCNMSTVRNLLNVLGEYENKFKRIKENPFSIRTSVCDYWLGYIIADGYISSNNYSITLSQNNDDKFHLINYANFLGLEILENKKVNQYYVKFSDKNTHAWFCNINIGPNKSNIVNPVLPLNRHMLRGIFDGDGSVGNSCKYVKITSGSPWLIGRISGFLDGQNIEYSLGKDKSKDIINHNPCYDLKISIKKDNLQKFYDLLYSGVEKESYLERKKVKMKKYLE